jgi:GTP-binding protein Era
LEQEKTKCGFAAIIGKPNSGKSTLLNVLLKQDLSIVTRKAQTTRNKIKAILTEKNTQVIFLDTPGILEPKYELQNFMLSEIKASLNEADLILYLTDAWKYDKESFIETEKKFEKEFKSKPRIIIINKIDLKKKEDIQGIIRDIKEITGEEKVIPVSALKRINIELLIEIIYDQLPESPFYYDEEYLTDKSTRFFVAEIIRKKVLELFSEEIPYSVFIDIREYKEREDHKDFINVDIIVERESQKIIIIGRRGEKIKIIGEKAREEIEKFLGKEVFLKLFVKVKKDWRNDKNFLKQQY